MAVPTGSGLPIWAIVLYSGDVRDEVLRREMLATSIQHIVELEFDGGTFKAIEGGSRESVLSFRLWNCGRGN